MPASHIMQSLLARDKGYYGDPCYDSTFGSTKAKCEDQTPAANLAYAVLQHYNIEISDPWVQGGAALKNGCCCPLDILNQDPISCIKMSLSASLLDKEYWEVYADEWGKASFVKVLPEGSARKAKLPRIQYCVPSLQPADIANLVIVRSADPPPFRKCGKVNGQDWYDVLDGASMVGLENISAGGHIFPGKGDARDARGVMFSWGEVTGFSSQTSDYTCERGKFDKFGTIIYPDYERKQIYNDGIIDLYELQGFEQILFWLVDIDYDSTDDELAHYSIQFVKSSDMPVKLGPISVGETYNGHIQDFGALCDVSSDETGTGTTPEIFLDVSRRADLADKSCTSVQKAVEAAKERANYTISWDEYGVPRFFGYGHAISMVSFNDYSKWSIVGADKCITEPIDNMYESTTSVWANCCPLDRWSWSSFLGSSWCIFGPQKAKKTMDLPNGSCWVESGDDGNGHIVFSFRAEAPSKASVKFGNEPWINPFSNHMMSVISSAWAGTAATNFSSSYRYPGYLFGWEDSLYTVSDLWAKTKVARPGLSIQGFGRGVRQFMPKIAMRVKPVYQVDFPAAVAARGDTYNGCVDVFKDLATANQAYCEPLTGETEAEKLQEAMTGNTIDITLPFLFPDFVAAGQAGPNDVHDKRAFDTLCSQCLGVAGFLWDYIKKYKNEPYKGYTYVCGPPKAQDEVPKLGDVVDTEHGPRTINSIAYSYSDGSSFTLNIDVGPVQLSTAHAGSLTSKRKKNEDVHGKIVDQVMGALYKVDVQSIGVIKAWNIDKHPWDIGDRVTVTLYNHPAEL
jgi:hypothetical protein